MKTTPSFTQAVYAVVKKIPKGKTMTYAEVAKVVGMSRAYRGVVNILNKNHDPAIPCHRVIRSDGSLGGYNCGAAQKRIRLKKESAILGR